MNEFSLIQQYFTECGQTNFAVECGIGDDAAVLSIDNSAKLVMTMDTLVEGVHFPKDTDPKDIAHKALAVNLSDLSAMGAKPAWFLLSLTMPEANVTWLNAFSKSLCQQANQYGIRLIGGDTCQGPLSITIHATGVVKNEAILRSNAQVGDHIFISGALGFAALGLSVHQKKIDTLTENEQCLKALNNPIPRLDISKIVYPFAHSMIDISDGLLSDLVHILNASRCGADIYMHRLPMPNYIDSQELYHYALAGGDDYELCFTVPEKSIEEMTERLQEQGLSVYDIGLITEDGLTVYDEHQIIELSGMKGFQHFG